MNQLQESGRRKEFPILIKGDVQGSATKPLSAAMLEQLATDEVGGRVVHNPVSAASPNRT